MITIKVNYFFTEYKIDIAKVHCRSFGGEWDVARETNGSIICTKNGLGWENSCSPCDTWRLLVFKSGSDHSGTGTESTTAGSYYGGYTPCGQGAELSWCGHWQSGK